MIKVKISKKNNKIYAFDISGHAEYDEYGKDIVCSAISVLVINTVNSIQKFTDATLVIDEYNKKTGNIKFKLDIEKGIYSSEVEVLLKSLELGLNSIKEQYGNQYIDIEEVQ